MNLEYREKIPKDFSDSSRVWIYQSNRKLETNEVQQIEGMLGQFVSNWKSHGETVKGSASLLFGHFIILMADETATGVSGCSTDSSVRIIKEIENQFSISLFDRQTLAFEIGKEIKLVPFIELNQAAEHNQINPETFYFNNLVLTKKELLQNWIIPIKDSWLAKRVNFRQLTV
jgi:hypothetical protein